MCEEYLVSFHKSDLIKILEEDDISKHYSININFVALYENHANLGLDLLKEPEKCLEQWDCAALKAQMVVLKEVDLKCPLKNNVHCRIYQLTACSHANGIFFPGNKDIGKLVQLSGTIMRITAAKLLEYQRTYICIKCKTPVVVKADYDRKYMIKEPKKCGNPEGCSGSNLVYFGELDSDSCKDYQEIKIQERIKELGASAMHNTMMVTLEDDLVDSCKPGDNVTICGIVKKRWGEFSKGNKIDISIALKANYLQVDNNSSSVGAFTPEVKHIFNTFWENHLDNPLLGRDTILKSICPQIYGLYFVKLAIAVVLAGGSQTEDTTLTGVRTRSESHLLLVGDPGTGKSQLLRFASKIIPRSVLTTGVGSTAAGLTVTAIMEGGEWQLEAGALVMSDGGICCIDEFNSMKEHDRTSIHEAMEQQTISIAKASMVCKLNTRCSVLAACNPKGNVDLSEPLCMSIALPSPLLSRFDLVLVLKDAVNEEWDGLVSDYILNGGNNFSKLTKSGLWNIDVLQSYFSMIKKFHPKLTEDAELILSKYYQMQRRISSRNKARTTVRLLESLVRLSQGHARLMYHANVEIIDSIYAIILIDTAMDRDSSILNVDVNANSIFPERPSNDYRKMISIILDKLELPLSLDKEISLLNKYKESKVQSRFFHQQNGIDDNEEVFKENDIRDNHVLDQVNDRSLVENKRKLNSFNIEVKNKKLKKSNDTNRSDLEIDEGYDTVCLSGTNLSNTKSKAIENNKKNLDHTSEINIVNFDTFTDKSVNKSGTMSINFCESSEIENKDLNQDKSQTGQSTQENKDRVLNQDSSNLRSISQNTHTVVKSNDNDSSNVSNQTNVTEVLTEKVVSQVNQKTEIIFDLPNVSKKSTIKDKLKKFKFISKAKDIDVYEDNNSKISNCDNTALDTKAYGPGNSQKTNIIVHKEWSNNINISEIVLQTKPDSVQSCDESSNLILEEKKNSNRMKGKSKEKSISKKSKDDFNSFDDDFDALKFIPGVNDGFNIDLDFDWDNFKPNKSLNSTMISSVTSKEVMVSNLSQSSRVKLIHDKFSLKPKLVKKLSSDSYSSTSSVVKSNSSISSVPRTIFEIEESLEDIDLDI